MKVPLLLDSWVLSTYSTAAFKGRLAEFVASGNFLPIVNALTFVELYNPGWRHARLTERGERVAEALAELEAAIVDPKMVARAEFMHYPAPLETLPVQLNLTDISLPLRREALLRFFRADSLFLAQGKDLHNWAAAWKKGKSTWASDRDEILAAAVRDHEIVPHAGGYRFASTESRATFLQSLDRRLFGWLTSEERAALGSHIVPLFLSDTAKLPAVRMSSLLFAYSYVDVPPTDRQRHLNSDLGDHWHLMIAPYCGAVTADKPMKRVLERLRPEAGLRCTVYGPDELKTALG